MKISEMQKIVDNWIKKYGVRYFSELTNMALLTEEVGELSRHMARTFGEQSYKKKVNGMIHKFSLSSGLKILIKLMESI